MAIDIITVSAGLALLSVIVAVLNLLTAGVSLAAAFITLKDKVRTRHRVRK